jgi:hypothetical protein
MERKNLCNLVVGDDGNSDDVDVVVVIGVVDEKRGDVAAANCLLFLLLDGWCLSNVFACECWRLEVSRIGDCCCLIDSRCCCCCCCVVVVGCIINASFLLIAT